MASAAFVVFLLASVSDLSDPWLSFSMTPGHPQERVSVEVGTVLRTSTEIAANPELIYWAKMSVRLSDLKGTYWTDSLRCPQLKTVLASVGDLKLPRIWTPENRSEITISTDAARYELTATSTYDERFGDELHIIALAETPLAAWFDDSYQALHTCWSGQRLR